MKFKPLLKSYLFFNFFFCFLFISSYSFAGNIEINQNEKLLIASESNHYQWFFNGTKIDGANDQTLCIEKSGIYTLQSIDETGSTHSESLKIVVDGNTIRKIYLIGDSTVTNYSASKYPMMGWGQVFQHFLDNTAFVVDNRAIGGRSSRSFIEEGRWEEVKADLKEGDYVLIQFGHNDRDWTKEERFTPPADFKTYLKQYVNDTRAIGAIPVLVSPMVMNAWRNGVLRNVFTESGNDYRGAMLEVANELDVPFIDLNMKSYELVAEWGYENARRFLYNYYLPGEYPNYPNGSNDGITHFQEMGAIEMAGFVAEGIQELKEDERIEPLASELLPLYPLTIKVNDPTAGVSSRSASYPAGVTITLKTLPETGHEFLLWKRADGTTISTNTLTSITKTAEEEIIYAFYDEETPVDCAGEFNGSAEIDACGTCTGGSTEEEACAAAFQMEEGCMDETAVETAYEGYLGQGYVSTEAAEDTFVEWIFDAPTETDVQLNFRYANGGEAERNAILYINDMDLGEVQFLPTDSWTDWAFSGKSVTLQTGKNKLKLVAQSENGLPNLDLIALNVSTLKPGECEGTVSHIPLEELAGAIKVFPNPFSNQLNIESIEPLQYQIFDSQGRLKLSGTCSGNCSISNTLAPGLYQLILKTSKGSYATKILKK